MRGFETSRMQGLSLVAVALMALALPAAAQQQARGGTGSGGAVQCPGCDSAQIAAARRRRLDAEIAVLTQEIARNRILHENLQSRLEPDSPEPPRSDREKAELSARLSALTNERSRLMRELSARCGEQEPIRGYLGITAEQTLSRETTAGGRSSTTLSYHVVQTVRPGTPAARAGLAPGDTIVAVNRMDARMSSLDPFLREPGAKLTLTIGRESGRRDIVVTVGQGPAMYGGACLAYRDFRFLDESGRNVVMFRQPGSGAVGGGPGARAGTVAGQSSAMRTRVNVAGGQQPVTVVLSPDSMTRSTFIMLPPGATGGAPFLSRGGTGAVVAGAEVSLVNGGLKTIFAVDYGALVLNVASRSPAEQAGIISGDVIVRANGEAVTAIAVLQRVIHSAHEQGSVALEVVRAKQRKQITLRW